MSESYGGGPTGAPGSSPQQSSGPMETAKHEAAEVKDTAAHEAGSVVESAKTEASAVAHEAKSQVKDLYAQTTRELKDQASAQQQRVAEGLRSVGGELRSMADGTQSGGMAADLVRQTSTKVNGVADWIGDRDPGSLLNEVKSYARRRPGVFIAAAALAGLAAGRLTRALTESAREESSSTGSTAALPATSGGTVSQPYAGAGPVATTSSANGVATGVPIPSAPDGVPGTAAGGASTASGTDTPVYDQTGGALDDPYREERP